MLRRLRKKLKFFKKDENGTAIVEFALLLPLIVLVLGIVLSGTQIAFGALTAYQASFISARMAEVAGSNVDSAIFQGDTFINNSPLAKTENIQVSCNQGSSTTTCTASGTINLIFPVINAHGIPTNQIQISTPMSLPTEG